jgi:hypothetical protein
LKNAEKNWEILLLKIIRNNKNEKTKLVLLNLIKSNNDKKD